MCFLRLMPSFEKTFSSIYTFHASMLRSSLASFFSFDSFRFAAFSPSYLGVLWYRFLSCPRVLRCLISFDCILVRLSNPDGMREPSPKLAEKLSDSHQINAMSRIQPRHAAHKSKIAAFRPFFANAFMVQKPEFLSES